jgi:hypothetical protein
MGHGWASWPAHAAARPGWPSLLGSRAPGGWETVGLAALICWFVTALAGLYLVAVWLIENDVSEQSTVASRLPGPSS